MRFWPFRHVPKKIMVGLCCVFLLGCSENGSTAESSSMSPPFVVASVEKVLPAEFEEGKATFNTFCFRCHGEQGIGTENGPPLVHKIYEPNHHADMAFQRAAVNGVRAHHWKFGNMPKIEGVQPEQVIQIIGYVRWLQRQAGIF